MNKTNTMLMNEAHWMYIDTQVESLADDCFSIFGLVSLKNIFSPFLCTSVNAFSQVL